jgi:hypothetical protein
MAIYCIDYINGSNVTGDGSPSAPWATLKGAVDQVTLTAGDEFRIHAGAEPVLLDSACTQTATASTTNNAIIYTSVDLTGSLAVGDEIFVGELTYTNRISAITSTQITFGNNSNYIQLPPRYSADGTQTFSIWKTGGVPRVMDTSTDIGTRAEMFSTPTGFIPYTDSITVSGGWADGFATKTALGRTIFYRTGIYQPAVQFAYGYLWSINTNGALDGFLFKDFHYTSIRGISGTATSTLIGINGDNLWGNSGGSSNYILMSLGRLPQSNIGNFYCTNWHIPFDMGNTVNYAIATGLEDTTLDNALNFSGGELRYTWINGDNNTSNLSCTLNAGSGVSPNISGLTHRNLFNPEWNGAPLNRRPQLALKMLRPYLAMPGFSTTNNGQFLDGQVLLMDNITIDGFPMVMTNNSSTSNLYGTLLIKLSQANLDKLYSLGYIAAGKGFYGRIFIEAPNNPWSLAAGGAYDYFSDTQSMVVPSSPQSVLWYDTTTSKKYFLLPSTVIEVDETDYATGTNALKIRPGAVGSISNVYGPYAKLADIRIGRTQTATITVKMKVSGTTSCGGVKLQYQSFADFNNFYNDGFSPNGTQILTTPESYTVTDSWADYTFTASLSNYFPAYAGIIDYAGDYYIPEMSIFLAIGKDGSPLAEAGKYIHVDSVSISII